MAVKYMVCEITLYSKPILFYLYCYHPTITTYQNYYAFSYWFPFSLLPQIYFPESTGMYFKNVSWITSFPPQNCLFLQPYAQSPFTSVTLVPQLWQTAILWPRHVPFPLPEILFLLSPQADSFSSFFVSYFQFKLT